jgi:3-(3-hydroxy-phenyl)propionate hydroxylase
MCSGIRDAANLAWKLDLVLAGKANDSLLDTYATERVPHVSMLIGFSMELGKVICIPDPAAAADRDAAMIAAAAEGQALKPPRSLSIGAGVLRSGDAHAGELFVQGRVRSGGHAGLFDDVVGRGWTLLAREGDPFDRLTPGAAEFFSGIGGISAHVGRNAAVADVDGVYEKWFEEAGVAVVLQRPDFYVFGCATALGGASDLVEELARVLRGPPQPSV